MLASVVVVARYRSAWYFYDEFALLRRVIGPHPVSAVYAPVNGHLWLLSFVAYYAQVHLLGVASRRLVYVLFCVALVALGAALGALLCELEVPTLPAAVGAVVVTFFGAAATEMVWEFTFGTTFALALLFAAALVVLRAAPRTRSALAVAGLLLAATAADSGLAVCGIVLVACFLVRRWPWRAAVAALVPAVVANAVYLLYAGTNTLGSASLLDQLKLAAHLVLRAAGGLVGGRGIVGGDETAGIVLLVVVAILVVPAVVQGRLCGLPLLGLVAGGTTAVVTALVIAHTRAGLIHGGLTLDVFFFVNNRYSQEVALFLLVGLLPAVWTSVVTLLPGARRGLALALAAALVVVFVINLSPGNDYWRYFRDLSGRTRQLVAETLVVIDHGCPDGRPPADDAQPLGALDPQVTVGLVRTLDRRGELAIPRPARAEPALIAAACPARH